MEQITPRHYAQVLEREMGVIERSIERLQMTFKAAKDCEVPPIARLRPADDGDLRVGQILWIPDSPEAKWRVIEEVFESGYYKAQGQLDSILFAYVEVESD